MNNLNKYDMKLMQIKDDEPRLLEGMINFHKNPTIKIFNKVISKLTADLYNDEIPDNKDEFFVTFENETWAEKRKRLRQITNPSEKQKEKQKYDNIKIVYTNPRVLSWIYAATREFPWLILETNATLLIERAIKYNDEGFYALTNKIIMGPIPKKTKNGEKESTDTSIRRWLKCVENYVEQSLLRYAASGNTYYIDYICEVESMVTILFKKDYSIRLNNASIYFNPRNEFTRHLVNSRSKFTKDKKDKILIE